MPMEATCPRCRTRLRGPDSAPGRTVECPRCRQVFRFPSEAASGAASVVEVRPRGRVNLRVCPMCGAQVRSTARTCGGCGATLAPLATQASRPTADRAIAVATDERLVASSVPSRMGSAKRTGRRRVLYGLTLVAVAAVAAGLGLSYSRSAELMAIVDECPSRRGVELGAHYDGLLSKDVVVFDLRGVSGDGVRRIDLVHLLLQFGHRLEKGSVRDVVLARNGRPIFRIGSAELRELTDEYTFGNPLWSINNLPSRVRRPDGSRPFPLPEGGWLYVLKEQTEAVNRFIADWSGM